MCTEVTCEQCGRPSQRKHPGVGIVRSPLVPFDGHDLKGSKGWQELADPLEDRPDGLEPKDTPGA